MMKLLCRTCYLILLAAASMQGQNDAANQARILAYIDGGWGTLSRSMSECKSLVDTKVTTEPILYLPAGMAVPASVLAAQKQCHIQVKTLPRIIKRLGDVKVSEIADPGLLYLPNKYVVPGGRFNEMYGWDSYFILLGLVSDHKDELARGMVENFFFEIENYGAVLNANRTYFFTRSQPPFLSSMIREVYGSGKDKVWLGKAYGYAVRDHALWISRDHAAGETGLARYHDLGDGPVPEMADDNEYYPDVIRWFMAHPVEAKGYLVETAAESCNGAVSKVCARAVVEGHRLSAAFYRGDRAMRESGFDTTFRFGPFSGSTDEYAPVCLNALLYKYEKDLGWMATQLGKTAEAAEWDRAAAARRAAMDKYLWNAADGMYYDYDFVTGKQSTYKYVTTFYPLWAHAASAAQATGVVGHLGDFSRSGGVAMSDRESGTQWDLPFGWAPGQWMTVSGLVAAGEREKAVPIARAFSATVMGNFVADGTIREKYNVVDGTANVKVAAGYKSNVVGFGWTNGVYLRMQEVLAGR